MENHKELESKKGPDRIAGNQDRHMHIGSLELTEKGVQRITIEESIRTRFASIRSREGINVTKLRPQPKGKPGLL